MIQRFDFDPQLTALPLAFDFNVVARLFEQHWLEDAGAPSPPPAINVGRLVDAHYQPSLYFGATYTLRVEQPGLAPRQTIGVVEIRPSGLTPRLFDSDPQMPWLVQATDRVGMRQRFAELQESVAEAATPEAWAITPIRYKPNARCVLRYDLHAPAGQRTFYGKTLAHNGDQLAATLTALEQANHAAPEMPRILRPLAYWPEVHLLLQPAVIGGIELHAYVFDPEADSAVRARWMQDAGASLAALHTSVRPHGPRRRLEDDLRELYTYCAPVAQLNSTLAAQFEKTIGEVAALTRDGAEIELVASHGAFRTDHILRQADGRLVFIDLDGFCWANPARDLGNFLAYLDWKAIRQPGHAAFIESASRAFLNGYTAVRPAPDADWVALYQAASMLKIIGRRYRGLNFSEWPLTPRLLDAVVMILNDRLRNTRA